MLEFAEEALDLIALTIDGRIDGALDLAILLGGDMCVIALGGGEIDDGLHIVAAIGDERRCRRQALYQCRDGSLVGGACPAESTILSGRPSWFTRTLILVLSPPRERPMG